MVLSVFLRKITPPICPTVAPAVAPTAAPFPNYKIKDGNKKEEKKGER